MRIPLLPEATTLRVFRVLTVGGLGALPIAAMATIMVFVFTSAGGFERGFGWDFKALWTAGTAFLEGTSPYPADLAALAGEDQFVYPAVAAMLAAPFALLPFPAASVLFALVLAASLVYTLWALGVRDWRCYGAAFLWGPVIDDIRLGAVSLLLAAGVAAAWRHRDHPFVAPAAVGLLAAGKIFLWPIGLWLVATRRYRSAAIAAGIALALNLGAWAAIGFVGFREYPALLGRLAELLQAKSYSVVAFALSLGLTAEQARVASLVAGGALLAFVVLLARRWRDERAAFFCALAGALALSPIVWSHYFVLLLVPVAIGRPRFGPLWLVPLALWVSTSQSDGSTERIAVATLVAALVLWRSARPPLTLPRRTGATTTPSIPAEA